jgi:hypothetical protein
MQAFKPLGIYKLKRKAMRLILIHLYTCFTHPFQTAERFLSKSMNSIFSKHVVLRDHIPCKHPIEHILLNAIGIAVAFHE